jgi:hypothetical protein
MMFQRGVRPARPAEQVHDAVGQGAAPAGVVVATAELTVGNVVVCGRQRIVESAGVGEQIAFFGAYVEEQAADAGSVEVSGRYVCATNLTALARPP